ncbi:AarF/ABC1/UbiB kinase family protein [Paenarthrobacter sp. Z7-10]|uniref:ABC1 kinase family protein n=1 Tax=Paenarthrobacter sp. Z7-10 TaxID=2787635 RepID=UPI0022A9E66C|nr:AarF/ABC1/UbiB kinase family protein [Paenarthrobacter sp. Z7-10]MCZ2402026.1 AarF/ABC1/UbiB kinase family protein [Paenarthrobacter sp. Z7-10]
MANHLERYRQVAETLSGHGLAWLLDATGLERLVPFPRGVGGRQHTPLSSAEHLRLALAELGPTFIKLGQVLSTRSDLLPAEFRNELAKLQDDAPALPAGTVEELIVQELGALPTSLFAAFDSEPLACASIGQAHAATSTDGTELVVKIRRPGVVRQIEEDLEILQNLAAQASRRWAGVEDYDLMGIAAEFSLTLRAELDYLQEGRSAERFSVNFAGDEGIHIPQIFWDFTTSRVLTMERIRGIKVSDLEALDAAGIDRRDLAKRAAGAAAKMIFEDGFFHADPHPGNLFIQDGGRIGLIDFGMVGKVDEKLRAQLGLLLLALVRHDPDRVTAALLDLATSHQVTEPARLQHDVVSLIELYEGKPLAEVPVVRLIQETLAILRRHHLQLPREMAMLLKMVLMTEGLGVLLDPTFQLGEVLAPYAQRLAVDRLSMAAFARKLGKAGSDAVELGLDLPGQLRHLLAIVDRDGVEVHLRAAELEPLVERMERIGNRLVVGMLTAAFIRGVGELTAADTSRWQKWQRPLLGSGLGVLGSLSAYLGWTALRKRRPR